MGQILLAIDQRNLAWSEVDFGMLLQLILHVLTTLGRRRFEKGRVGWLVVGRTVTEQQRTHSTGDFDMMFLHFPCSVSVLGRHRCEQAALEGRVIFRGRT